MYGIIPKKALNNNYRTWGCWADLLRTQLKEFKPIHWWNYDGIINLMKKTAQQIQDNIFRRMSAEKKIKLISSFWHSAKTISGTSKIYHNIDGIREHIKKSH